MLKERVWFPLSIELCFLCTPVGSGQHVFLKQHTGENPVCICSLHVHNVSTPEHAGLSAYNYLYLTNQ